jgi:hypothetical protein
VIPIENRTVSQMDGELVQLLDRRSTPRERARALRDLGAAMVRRAGDMARLLDECGSALSAAVPRLPIRDAAALRAAYGTDAEIVAGQVIEDAATLAGWLWTATAAVPAPPPVSHAIKTAVHAAIEIRMIGELYAIHTYQDAARDPAWLNAVLYTWAGGRPVAVGPGTVTATPHVAVKLRQAHDELANPGGRLSQLASRGRDGSDAVRRAGWRCHRRMRLHPRTWPQPQSLTGTQTATQAAAVVLGRPLPVPPDPTPGQPGKPHDHLRVAWAEHLCASADAADVTDADVQDRLVNALAQQEAHLRWLSLKVGRPTVGPTTVTGQPGEQDDGATASAQDHLQRADDAIDRAEDTGARPRRLASWPARVRNGLVYLLTAVGLYAPGVGLVLTGQVRSPTAVLTLLVTLCVAGPVLTVGLGATVIRTLFRPWLSGRLPRSPFVGLTIGVVVAVAAATIVALS